jgi:hypothetical protein
MNTGDYVEIPCDRAVWGLGPRLLFLALAATG